LGEIVKDESAASPYEMVESDNIKKAIKELLPILDKREYDILALRFGLVGDGKELTLEEVGKKFKVTRERIRQLQNMALRKLKKALDKKDKGSRS
jgi:RNA polymerase primary sigma factor